MARNPRLDTPGSWHHVMNRGIAKRTLFEGERDVRFFLARLAAAVRRGQVEVHAWCILTTHFHLLLRSPRGQLSEAMQRIQLDYSRRFNRTRGRDGTLVRGRFRSKAVGSAWYRRILVRYIDSNATRAKLARRPMDYRYGSARWFARSIGPKWHERGWIESEVCRVAELDAFDPQAYALAFPFERSSEIRYIVERRLVPKSTVSSGSDLFELATPNVQAWMRRKARLADGTKPGLAVAAPQAVRTGVEKLALERGTWRARLSRQPRDLWLVLQIGLLRDLSGATWQEIGRAVKRAPSHAASMGRLHFELLGSDAEYERRACEVARRAVLS